MKISGVTSLTVDIIFMVCSVCLLYLLINLMLQRIQNDILDWHFWLHAICLAIQITVFSDIMYERIEYYLDIFQCWKAKQAR